MLLFTLKVSLSQKLAAVFDLPYGCLLNPSLDKTVRVDVSAQENHNILKQSWKSAMKRPVPAPGLPPKTHPSVSLSSASFLREQ